MKQQITQPIDSLYDLQPWIHYNVIPDDDQSLEVTVTFNHKIHDKASSLASLSYECKNNIISYITTILQPNTIIYSIEYQKNGYAHLHAILIYDDPDDLPTPEYRYDFTKSMTRKAGDTTCRPVINPQSYIEYIYKDVQQNESKKQFKHNYIWTRKHVPVTKSTNKIHYFPNNF